MKKFIVISLAALILFGCVLSAGCTFGDPIVGVWKLTEPTDIGTQESEGYDVYLTFVGNGAGFENYYLEEEESDETDTSSSYSSGSSSSTSNISWKKLDDTNYYIVFQDRDDTGVLDSTKTKLTTSWGVYTKIN